MTSAMYRLVSSTVKSSAAVPMGASFSAARYPDTAAFMSAPAGLAMAKILVPPAAQEEDHHEDVEIPRATNVIEAAADGAMAGLNIAVAVGATLLAFVGVIALLNGLLGWAGDLVGLELSFQIILGWLFAPVSWLIGVPWDQAQAAGLAVVVRSQSGAAERLTHGVDALLADDDAALAAAVVRLVREPGLREGITAHNRATPPPYDWEDVLERTAAVYDAAAALRA